MRAHRIIAFAVLAAGLAAPSWAAADPVAASSDVKPYIDDIASKGEQDRVLDDMEIGTRYFWRGDAPDSAHAFDDAIVNIEHVFLNDPSVTKARSLWYEEGAKTFKGEPYERAMVYYYRGLLYLKAGDYENARAAFRQGEMQDAFAEEQQDQTDFALLYYLEAWASHLNGDTGLADDALAMARKIKPDCPGFAEGADTLVIAETGTAPRKLGDGADHSYFVYRRGKGFTENHAELVKGDQTRPLFPIADVYFQASTRGGREVDAILEGKVRFKRTTGDAGSGLANGATIVSALGGGGAVAGALGGVGALATLISSKAKPRADTRAWSSLPDRISVGTFAASSLDGTDVRFLVGESPANIPDATLTIFTDPKGHRIALVRSR